MNVRNKFLHRNWKRWIAMLMVMVMLLLQPCTAMADAKISRTAVKETWEEVTDTSEDIEKELEAPSDRKSDILLNEDSEELQEEDFELPLDVEMERSTEVLAETELEVFVDVETESYAEEDLPDIETESEVPVDIEPEKVDQIDSEIIQETESDVSEDMFSGKQTAGNIYTVTFFADNMVIDTQTVEEGEDAEEPAGPEKPGYTFLGWSGDYTKVTNNRNLYASYLKGVYTTYRMEFLDYDDRPIRNAQYVVEGWDASRPVSPVMEGNTFVGWDGSWFEVRKDMVIRAKYRVGEHTTYVLRYYGRSNQNQVSHILKEEWVVEGEDGTPPELEENEIYTFAGWDKGKPYTNVRENNTIYAYYYGGKLKTHKVEFVDFDGKALMNPQYVIDGYAIESPVAPYKTGYTFTGWDRGFYRITAPVKIQAVYREGNYATQPVYFYGRITGNLSWILLKTEYVPIGEDAHPPKLPVNAGYTFREWSGQLTGIQSSQNVYAQYDKNTEPMRTITVRFWNRGEVIKTEEVQEGGDATAPAVSVAKGYSFVGWDKSYVNINPQNRSVGAIDITAQYQLSSSMQNAGSLTDLVNALIALGVPLAVKDGFAALGAAIINPFDGIILDVLAATALVGTIIYYWDDIKGLWEDIKIIFRNFAGMDAAGEILGNIEAGVDEAGKGEVDFEAIARDLGDIAGKYGYNDIDEDGYGKCKVAADEMVEYLKKNKQNGAVINLMWSPRDSGYIWSDYAGKVAGDNGLHVGVLYEGRVYCNVHPYGLPKQQWIDDFNCMPPAIKMPPFEVPF